MNNLKRILSLALASVMVMGMMVTGASAAKFSDSEDITHDAAVDVMAALGIINGMDDGSFNPNGDVTRAQMAKMITVAVNGKDPKMGKPDSSTFADSASHWALEYIEYCANLGIINGRSETTFDPEGKVTAAEAAKMILVALGFDAEVFQLVGANWSKNTMTLAQNLRVGQTVASSKTLNLFNGLGNIGANTPLSRDQAAQLIYNGINSNTVVMALTGVEGGTLTGILGGASGQTPKYDWSLTGKPLLETKFGATVDEGVLTAADYDEDAETWDYSVCYYDDDGVLGTTPRNFVFDEDISDRFMQSVRVIYRELKGNRTSVLAITAAGDDVLEDIAWGDVDPDDDKNTVNGYNLGTKAVAQNGTETTFTTADLPVYSFLVTTAGDLTDDYHLYDSVKLIDNNGDGRLDCIVVTPVNVEQVTIIRPTYIQIRNLGVNVVLEENNVEAGLEVGDFVTYTVNPETEVITVVKAETVTGAMTASQDAILGRRPDRVQVGGEWYTVIANYSDGANIKGLVGNDVELILAAGYVVNGKALTAATTSSDAVMVVAKAGATTQTTNNIYVDANATYLEVKILKADGTTENMKVTKVGSNAVSAATDIDTGKLYTYTTDPNANGCVILTAYDPAVATDQPAPQNPAFNDKLTSSDNFKVNSGLVAATGKSFRIAEDGTFFVMAGTKYAAVKGADMAKWYQDEGYIAQAGSVVYADKASNGYVYAKTGAIILNEEAIPGATGATMYYGYVTANAYFTKGADGTTYVVATVWNGAENVTVRAKTKTVITPGENEGDEPTVATSNIAQGDEKAFTVGTLVSYLDNDDGTASALTGLAVGAKDAVTAWDNSKVKFYTKEAGKELVVDNNTVILFIDGTKRTGVANGAIQVAQYVDPFDVSEGIYANVYYVETSPLQNTDGHVDLLVLDINGKIAKTSTTWEILGADEEQDPAECAHTETEWKKATAAGTAEDDTEYAIGDHTKVCKNSECEKVLTSHEADWDTPAFDTTSNPHSHIATCKNCTIKNDAEQCEGNDSNPEYDSIDDEGTAKHAVKCDTCGEPLEYENCEDNDSDNNCDTCGEAMTGRS